MRKFLPLLLGVILIHCQLAAQNKIDFREFTLDNGLHVIMHKDNSTPIVVTSVLYHVGSKNEDPDKTGFAHFFEHLLFEGSENIERGQYTDLVEGSGGALNASTSNDVTYYYESMPSNYLELALYLESERMLHAKIDEVGLETQREVVKEEKRQRIDNQPYGSLLTETLARAYTKHPYQWAPIGSLEHLNAANLEDFKQFYEEFYVPNNAILTVAGDIDYEQTEEWVRKYFSEIPMGSEEIYRPQIEEPEKTEEVRDTIYDNIQVPAVIQAYNLPPKDHPDTYALEMLSTYLTGGKSSLMTKELVDKQQKALFMQAIPLDLEDGGIFIMYGFTNMGVDPSDLESEIDKLIVQVQEEGITELEFQKLQNIIENDLVSKNASIEGIAQNLAEAKLFYGSTDHINQELEKFQEVTISDIQRVAKEYLTLDGRVVMYYLPKSQETAENQ